MALIDKLTSIAGKIRTLLGLSDNMSLVAMSDNLGEAINECDTQAELIQQIKTALSGKAAGGGSYGGTSGIYMAKITPAENVTGNFSITHNLGTTDILYVAVYTC